MLRVNVCQKRYWKDTGKTLVGHRRYDLAKLKPELFRTNRQSRQAIAYAQVSSHDQKDDLERQKQVLELYCANQGWTFEIIADLGSGMHYRKKGLKRLLDDVIEGRVERLVISH